MWMPGSWFGLPGQLGWACCGLPPVSCPACHLPCCSLLPRGAPEPCTSPPAGRLPPGRQYGEPGFRDPLIPDTRLTRQGRAQAAAARAAAGALAPPPQALLVSPLTRALQTADIMFEGLRWV